MAAPQAREVTLNGRGLDTAMAGAWTFRWQGLGTVSIPRPYFEMSTDGKGGRPKGQQIAYTIMFDVWQRKGSTCMASKIAFFASFTVTICYNNNIKAGILLVIQ